MLLEPQANRFGVRVFDHEREHRPRSLTLLSDETAAQLVHLMSAVTRGFLTSEVLVNEVVILWTINTTGEVWFSVEEIFYEGEPVGLPKFKDFPPTINLPKLGHPALVMDNAELEARISGEIYFALELDRPQWVINNWSGRYGRHPSRSRTHLLNAAKQFRDKGMKLVPNFEY